MPKFVSQKVIPYVFGAVICVMLVLYPAYLLGYLDPIPYQSVVVKSVDKVDGRVEIRADFVKRRCQFDKLAVVGIGLFGASPPLEWSDLDARKEDEINRMAGAQTLRISVDLNGQQFDNLEIKTRHLCGDLVVDTVFANISLTK